MRNSLKNERGMALAFMAVGLAAFIGLTVVGVDFARLAFTATETQTVADLAATAAAQSVFDNAYRGTTRDPIADGYAVANRNAIDGVVVPAVDDQNADINVHIELGNYNANATPKFSTGRTPTNAARAAAHRRVTNFIAAAIGSPQTPVDKIAIAPIVGPTSGCNAPVDEDGNALCGTNDWACYCENGVLPCLPLAVADCQFNSLDQLPELTVAPQGTAFWTGFQTGHASSDVRQFLDQGPCDPNGGGSVITSQSVGGSTIDVTNGITSACSNEGKEFGLMKCVFENELGCSDTNGDNIPDQAGGLMFAIPVFHQSPCDPNASGPQPLVGFATVELTSVCVGDDTNVNVEVVSRNMADPGPLGGGCFGTDCFVKLVQ